MPKMNLSHLEMSLLFALALSVVLGITSKKTSKEQIHYGVKSFGYFVGALVGLSWLMYFGHH
jgi:hypothetical protein